jgi:hypothetical protein
MSPAQTNRHRPELQRRAERSGELKARSSSSCCSPQVQQLGVMYETACCGVINTAAPKAKTTNALIFFMVGALKHFEQPLASPVRRMGAGISLATLRNKRGGARRETRVHRSPSGCRLTTRMRLRFTNRLAGFSAIAASNEARAMKLKLNSFGLTTAQ